LFKLLEKPFKIQILDSQPEQKCGRRKGVGYHISDILHEVLFYNFVSVKT